MATKELKRFDCVCDKCGHQWTTRLEGLPKNCPNCLARIQVWNKSEHLVDVADDVDKLSMEK